MINSGWYGRIGKAVHWLRPYINGTLLFRSDIMEALKPLGFPLPFQQGGYQPTNWTWFYPSILLLDIIIETPRDVWPHFILSLTTIPTTPIISLLFRSYCLYLYPISIYFIPTFPLCICIFGVQPLIVGNVGQTSFWHFCHGRACNNQPEQHKR